MRDPFADWSEDDVAEERARQDVKGRPRTREATAFGGAVLLPEDRRTGPSLFEACRILGLPPPDKGEPVDLAAARAAKREIIRARHPDSSGEETIEGAAAMGAAVAAYALVESYNRSLGKG